jgi:hypothetical protein
LVFKDHVFQGDGTDTSKQLESPSSSTSSSTNNRINESRESLVNLQTILFQHLSRPDDVQGPLPEEYSANTDNKFCPKHQRILLYASSQLDPNGIGAQLNTYLQAVLTALATNRSLVLLHRQKESYFGCVSHKHTGTTSYPGGLSRLVRPVDWVSLPQQCGLPCGKNTKEWLQVAHNLRQPVQLDGVGMNASSMFVTCGSTPLSPTTVKPYKDDHQETVSVLVLGGYNLRRYFTQYVIPALSQPAYITKVWASRFQPTSDTAQHIALLSRFNVRHKDGDDSDSDDDDASRNKQWIQAVMAQLAKLGVLQFQPWIAQSIQEKFLDWIQMEPLAAAFFQGDSSPYIGVHVRRGDKLLVEAKGWVDQYWNSTPSKEFTTNVTNDATHPNYIPFEAYMNHVIQASQILQRPSSQTESPINVYVATDDLATVKGEIENLSPAMQNDFAFWFHPATRDSSADSIIGHIREAGNDCQNRYDRTIASVMDLILLTRSSVFVGEYNSNWGRLVRAHRSIFDLQGGSVGLRPVHLVFGPSETFWPR